MGKLTGLLMIIAGVGTAAYVYPLVADNPEKAEKQLADVVAIAAPGAAEVKRAAAPVPVAVAPSASRVITAPSADANRPGLVTAPQMTAPSPQVVAQAPAVDPKPAVAAPVAATPPPPAPAPAVVAPPAAPTQATVPTATPVLIAKPVEVPTPQAAKRGKADEERAALAKSIQAELKRVGCFQGDADGTWNTGTRQAMKTFIDRVNATLPVDEPDHILKTLVQGHPGNACGKSCPTGQTAGTEGRCLPTTIMTQAPATPAKAAVAQSPQVVSTTAKPAAAEQPVAQPVPQTPRPATTASAPTQPSTSSWETSSIATAVVPAMGAIAALSGTQRDDAKRPPDLPGRMAIGAAAPEPAPQQAVTASEPPAPRTRVVVKPKDTATRDEPAQAEKTEKPASRPSVGAVAAASESVKRAAPPAPAPAPRVAAYRAPPPPRYVGAYVPTPAPAARPRFGPQIFRQLESAGR